MPAELKSWTMDEHHADRTALSFSLLSLFGVLGEGQEDANPGLFWAHFKGHADPVERPALALGRLLHMAVFEPERVIDAIAVRPTKPDGTLVRANSNAYKEWAEQQGGRQIVAPVDLAVTVGVLEACKRSPALAKLRRHEEIYCEQSIVWTDDDTGLKLKIRPDSVRRRSDGAWIMADLKTTQDASPAAFRRSCERYRYFDRAAFYADGIEALTGERPRVALIAATKERPFQAAVYEPRQSRLDEGRARNRAVLREIARRTDAGDWLAPWEAEPTML